MKMHKGLPLRRSIVWRLFGTTFLCLFLLLVFNWLLNNFALVSYYRSVKQRSLEDGFTRINSMYSGSAEDISGELYRLSSDNGLQITIWMRTQLIYDSRPGEIGGGGRLYPEIVLEPGTYQLGEGKDSRTGSGILSLAGRFSNGYSVIISTPVAAIEESVGITNRFLLISGAVTLLFSIVFVLVFARSFTRPIRELSRVAGSVSRLDFDDRYTVKGNNELSDLGRSINTMADALEGTISDLKTANLQLVNDNEQKTRQSEARRAFIANISHELKTPISLIQTYAEGLKEDIAGGGANRDFYCEVIEDEAAKMGALIKKMTMLMQIEAGGEELVIERFDLCELIYGLLQKNTPRFEEKRVALSPPPPRPVYVWADEFLMENVLQNYLSNALNHVNDGGQIAVTLTPAKEGRLRVAVYNSGSHIPEDDLERIWDSFYKVDKARTRAYGGTGIGLSVVAAIMKAHHMPYGVINREQGVEFFIELDTVSRDSGAESESP